jgi:hypothetical protein
VQGRRRLRGPFDATAAPPCAHRAGGGDCRVFLGRRLLRPYKVRLEGARAYRQAAAAVGKPEGGFVNGVEPDMSKGACRAEAAFTLDATVKTVDAQVVCDPAK